MQRFFSVFGSFLIQVGFCQIKVFGKCLHWLMEQNGNPNENSHFENFLPKNIFTVNQSAQNFGIWQKSHMRNFHWGFWQDDFVHPSLSLMSISSQQKMAQCGGNLFGCFKHRVQGGAQMVNREDSWSGHRQKDQWILEIKSMERDSENCCTPPPWGMVCLAFGISGSAVRVCEPARRHFSVHLRVPCRRASSGMPCWKGFEVCGMADQIVTRDHNPVDWMLGGAFAREVIKLVASVQGALVKVGREWLVTTMIIAWHGHMQKTMHLRDPKHGKEQWELP